MTMLSCLPACHRNLHWFLAEMQDPTAFVAGRDGECSRGRGAGQAASGKTSVPPSSPTFCTPLPAAWHGQMQVTRLLKGT